MMQVFGCALHYYPAQSDWFPFVHCVEQHEPDSMKASVQECSNASNPPLDFERIHDCAIGRLGEQLQMELKAKTDALVPAHEWVPWLTVNGVPLWDDNDNLQQYICAAYGGPRPSSCYEKHDAQTPLNSGQAKCPRNPIVHDK